MTRTMSREIKDKRKVQPAKPPEQPRPAVKAAEEHIERHRETFEELAKR